MSDNYTCTDDFIEALDTLESTVQGYRPIVEAAQEAAALDTHMWCDLAPKMTCSEAEVIADFLRLAGNDSIADAFAASHAEGDEPSDLHHPDSKAYHDALAQEGE